jgi:phosphoribosylamine--glycine ligase
LYFNLPQNSHYSNYFVVNRNNGNFNDKYFSTFAAVLSTFIIMNILLLGSGGREHAFAWKIKQSPLCTALFIAPGNAGTEQFGKNINMTVTDFAAIRSFCLAEKIDMVVVGPEDPLVNGIYDFIKNDKELERVIVIGPSSAAAQLEGSKAFSKQFMQRHNIPTAAYAEFNEKNFDDGIAYLDKHSLPIVLKADGLAAGKGVVICESVAEAKDVFTAMIKGKQFGEASAKVVVEQFLKGIEVSVFALTDGKNYKIIGHAKDYKRIGVGDTGLNTGGMGCVSPVPFLDAAFFKKIEEKIIAPTIAGINEENLVYKGIVFFGLIKVLEEPFVIEYNCRMGDPETEVVLPRLKNDIVELFVATENGNLSSKNIDIDERSCGTIVAVSGGYPGAYKKGLTITGIEKAKNVESVIVFHCGTEETGNGVSTSGGRVLAVTSYGADIKMATKNAVKALENIQFEGMYFRHDIGYEF